MKGIGKKVKLMKVRKWNFKTKTFPKRKLCTITRKQKLNEISVTKALNY